MMISKNESIDKCLYNYIVCVCIINFFWIFLIIFWCENNEIDRCVYLYVLLCVFK